LAVAERDYAAGVGRGCGGAKEGEGVMTERLTAEALREIRERCEAGRLDALDIMQSRLHAEMVAATANDSRCAKEHAQLASWLGDLE
jgi:hypothetical protein